MVPKHGGSVRELLVDFIRLEIELSLTFAEIARDSVDTSKRERNAGKAYLAYRTARRFLKNKSLQPEQRQKLTRQLKTLEAELVNLDRLRPSRIRKPKVF